MRAPEYELAPIGSRKSLGRHLSISPKELYTLAARAEQYYRPVKPIEKDSGTLRQTYEVLSPLKEIQALIHARILQRVKFPPYLFAVRNDEQRRDYVSEVLKHTGQITVCCIDIENFFDTVQQRFILQTWQYFFNFPPDVAEILTAITAYRGVLPQGASTSPYLAILLLHNTEPELEARLRQNGFVYTRYIDDITVSSGNALSRKQKTWVVNEITSMLYRYELRLNRAKLTIRVPSEQQRVHGLNLNSGRATKPKLTRAKIRAAVGECETLAKDSRLTDDYWKCWKSASGRVGDLRRVHPKEAKALQSRLDVICPLKGERS